MLFLDWREKILWEIVEFHYKNNSFYRNLVGNKLPAEWSDLPIMTKYDLQGNINSKISTCYNPKKLYMANTSGSTGHPFFFVKNKEAHALHWALIKKKYNDHSISLNSKQARFFGIPMEFLGNFKERWKDVLMNRVRMPIFDLSDKNLFHFLQIFSKKNFKYIYGYTNSILTFAKYLIKNKIRLDNICPSLIACITTSELLVEHDRALLEMAFNINVINEYGASEVGLIAIENKFKEMVLCEETVFVEICNKGSFEKYPNSGSILLTSLHNKAMPFIRYNIGDIGSLNDKISNHSQKQTFNHLLGRENDLIVLPSGKKSPGLTFYYVSRSIIESSGIIKEFIIRQKTLDTFQFDIVSNGDLSVDHINDIQEKLDKYLEPNLKLIINNVPKIERSSSGKIKHFYSEIEC